MFSIGMFGPRPPWADRNLEAHQAPEDGHLAAPESRRDFRGCQLFIDIQMLELCRLDRYECGLRSNAHRLQSRNPFAIRQCPIFQTVPKPAGERPGGYGESEGLRSNQGRAASICAARRNSVASSP
jgi:hypothetical protein